MGGFSICGGGGKLVEPGLDWALGAGRWADWVNWLG